MTSLASQWSSKLAALYAQEREAMVQFLLALEEFDRKKLWAELGYSGLFNFLAQELRMPGGSAHMRKVAVELIRRLPAVVEPLRDGRLCLSSLFELSKVVTDDNWQDVLPRFFGCSKRDAVRISAQLAPLDAPPMRDVVRVLGRASAAPAPAPRTSSDSGRQGIAALQVSAPANGSGLMSDGGTQANDARKGASPLPLSLQLRPAEVTRSSEASTGETAASAAAPPNVDASAAPLLHRLSFTAPEAFMADLTQVKETMAFEFPEGDLLSIFHAGLKLLLEKRAKREARVQKPRTRNASASTSAENAPRRTASPADPIVASACMETPSAAEASSGTNREPSVAPRDVPQEVSAAVAPSGERGEAPPAAPSQEPPAANDDVDSGARGASDPRYIPAAVRRAVWERDGHQCQWRLASGRICGDRKFLELDHVIPVALGGLSTVENLRTVCHRHNQMAARQVFGDAWMDQAIRERKARTNTGETVFVHGARK
jgi:hypothetical protein